jgi:hypothetical protein
VEPYDFSYFNNVLMLLKIVLNYCCIANAQVEVIHRFNIIDKYQTSLEGKVLLD